jgi:hypothetical protein
MAENERMDLIDEDLGGVQGTDGGSAERQEAEFAAEGLAPDIRGETPDQPAPDAGEIEWAGALVKKPPAPAN